MADAYVQVRPDDSGKKVQTFESTIGGQVVEAQATVEVNPATGAPLSPATASGQATGNTTLASIDGKIPVQGQALMSGSVPVTLASDQVGMWDRYGRRTSEALIVAAMDGETTALLRRSGERGSLVDRRGSVGRGTR